MKGEQIAQGKLLEALHEVEKFVAEEQLRLRDGDSNPQQARVRLHKARLMLQEVLVELTGDDTCDYYYNTLS